MHCSEDQCTWSCEIDSKKKFQFQFSKPSTLTQNKIKTITMHIGSHDWFSCSSGFCCNTFYEVNFKSKNSTDSNHFDWIESKESTSSYTAPDFLTWCSKETPCTENKSSGSKDTTDLTLTTQESQRSSNSSLPQKQVRKSKEKGSQSQATLILILTT
ncbi:hypothetical protein HMI55_005404, partial [Coelomomyces lativittatus]